MANVAVWQMNIDGLNLGVEAFRFANDDLIILHSRNGANNIAVARIVIHDPEETDTADYRLDHDNITTNVGKAVKVVRIFLACYYLMNHKNMPKVIPYPSGGMTGKYDPNLADTYVKNHGGMTTPYISEFKSNLESEDIDAMNKTRNLYDKIMLIEKNSQKKNPVKHDRLFVSLYYYQRAIEEAHDVEGSFLDLVTCIETLYHNNVGELSYKFALYTASIVENDKSKRFLLYTKLKEIYGLRSDSTHGNDIPINPWKLYSDNKKQLEFFARQVLLYYIDLAFTGYTQKQIIELIDKSLLEG